ncbi:hypothetical protein RN001_009615 [Aquatica leii]|uniref:Glutathione S-transferase n=1 Tax=Aquatica leii TaxID=1421715 RepID=A0AAN7SFQ5_9COLE|nr:hypothetical protein RN001_009615 [Aquatica leii]
MPLILYKFNPGPTARTILITGAAIGIKFEEREMTLPHGHYKEKFLKMIPMPALPTLDDNGQFLCDSHAITSYLVDKYAEKDDLYPKDLYQRALVNQALAFDLGTTFSILVNLNQAYLREEISCLSPKWITTIQLAYDRLETMLQDKEWVALDRVTIGDFSCYTTTTSLDYYLPIDSKNPGPTVRAVLITGAAIGITFEEHEIDVPNGEHLTEKFSKINPMHTLPTLDDNGQILYDSHAINSYLVDKYGKNNTLYPNDLYQRALVNQALGFDLEVIFPILVKLNQAYFEKEITCLTPTWIITIEMAYARLELMLFNKEWIALDCVTIGDFSCYTTITSLDYHLPINSEKYPSIKKWMERCQNLPYVKNDSANFQKFVDLMNSRGVKPHVENKKHCEHE